VTVLTFMDTVVSRS